MDQVQPVGRIDVISDVICPWCYIGKRHLESALVTLGKQGLHFTVAWHPFQLNPDMPREGVDRAQYRLTKFGSAERSRQLDERITETATTVGLEFHLDKLTRTPNTLDAHRLIRLAGQRGLQDGVVEALFEGYFCDGADIGNAEVLAGDQMARNCGIQGVPSFALQGHVLFSGAVPAEEMAQTFRRAWEILKNQAA